jgi:hypothetical protein
MHALLKQIGFATVLEFPTPVHEAQRSIFLAFQSGHPFADFVAQHADRAKPRFTGAPRKPAEGATAPLNIQAQAEFQALRADVGALQAGVEALRTDVGALQAERKALQADAGALRAEALRRATAGVRTVVVSHQVV